ncbi:unnamed protein product [Sphagnum troendelagicum]|uniref:non-specific serine/threonine protein kinase n=1 Tax=Sphagnum troendelagicum TaxID=128251 RepID=A0ABP0U458_9BRYO
MDKPKRTRKAMLTLLIAVLEALVCTLSSAPGVWAQIQGSVFVDCGSMASYVGSITNISWVPDAPEYITTGVNGYVPSAPSIYPNFSEFTTVRYFPDTRAKNCYSFPVMPNSTYLIRGTFFYGNYDNGTTLPSFQMAIDGTIVANVTFDNATIFVYYEFMVASVSNVTFLCLLRDSSNSVPFISAISFSFLPAYFFFSSVYGLLYGPQRIYFETKYRLNFGGDGLVRHPDDEFDRYWFPIQGSNSTFIQSTSALQSLVASQIVGPTNMLWGEPPDTVMDTALTSSGNITITFPDDENYNYILSFYYAELNSTANASSRIFYLEVPRFGVTLLNPYSDSLNAAFTPIIQVYGDVPYTPGTDIVLYPDQTVSSPLGPIANALETWEMSTNPIAPMTNNQDAIAIEEIKSSMSLTDWTGDPCVPVPHPWVTCSTDSNFVPSITAVNLSGYNLTGPISPSFGNLLNLTSLALDYNDLNGSLPLLKRLTNLQYLFLQNNSLSGMIPNWLADLPSLSELFAWNNNFSGPIPPTLFSKNSKWNFTYFPGNPFLQGLSSTKSTNIAIIIGPLLGGILALVIIIFLILCIKRKSHTKGFTKTEERTLTSGDLQMVKFARANPYSLAQVTIATENFKIQIGKGGFGPMYYGKFEDGKEVAIKVLDIKSSQGPSKFFNEVDILSRVNHRNLVSLIGYCLEDDQKMLIYEYMQKGSLCDHLYGDLSTSANEQLDWTTRLHIALNASQGLEYLHSGCNPSIIHCDVKTSNILLPSNMKNAKVANFGLSRLTYGENITHITTNVKGTSGYLDPQYLTSQCLSVKNDVYSFGVVLLEIIFGCKAIDTTLPNRKAWNLCDWVRFNLQEGNINKILDPIVKASNPNLDAIWKVVEIAIQCVEPKAIHRPIMTKVVEELRAAITIQEGKALPSNYSHSMTCEIQDQSKTQMVLMSP